MSDQTKTKTRKNTKPSTKGIKQFFRDNAESLYKDYIIDMDKLTIEELIDISYNRLQKNKAQKKILESDFFKYMDSKKSNFSVNVNVSDNVDNDEKIVIKGNELTKDDIDHLDLKRLEIKK